MVPPNEPIGDDASQDTPDWLADGDLDSDDAMAWLEEIAAKYDPDFEKSADAVDLADEATPDKEPELVTSSPSADADALPDWLAEEEPAAESTVEDEADDELPDWLKDEEPVPAPAVEPAAASVEETGEEEDSSLPDWMRDEAPVAAPAAVSAGSDESEEDDEEDELPAWLRDEEPAPAPASESVEDELAWLREPVETPEAIVSDDSDELPDWLTDEEPAMQAATASAAGEETEDALAWLNQHVSDQGVSPDEIASESLKVDTPPTTPVTATPLPDAEAEAVSDDELPDWLKEAGGTEAMAEALAGEPSDFDLEDIPELEADPTELAWLADTLDAESEKADDELAALFGELEEEEAEKVVESAAEVEAEPAAEEEVPAPVMAKEPEPEEEAEAEEEEDLPDWLTEEEPKPTPGLTDWLRSPKVEKEEEAPAPAMTEKPEEEPAVETAPDLPPSAPVAVPAAPIQPVEIPEALRGDFMGQLNTAREQMKAKAHNEALALYENLVSHKQMLEQTISDMEYAAQSADKPDPRIRRTLGDALRASGRLQEALEAYRAALDEL